MNNTQKMDSNRRTAQIVFAILLAIASATTISYFYTKGEVIVNDALEAPMSTSEALAVLGGPIVPVEEISLPVDAEAVIEAPEVVEVEEILPEVVVITQDDVLFALYDEDVSIEEFDILIEEWTAQEYSNFEKAILDVEIAVMEKEAADLEAKKPFWKKWFKTKGVDDAAGTK